MKYTLLHDVTRRLAMRSETAPLDASVLLAHISGRPRSRVLAEPDLALSTDQRGGLEIALDRLELGEPLPYVLGNWEFYGLEFAVTPDVLIPRPETEVLIEKALAWLNKWPGAGIVADVGTGAGCIAIALAVRNSDVRVLATDLSAAALEVAHRNAARHGVNHRIEFVHCDLLPSRSVPGAIGAKTEWWGGGRRKCDLICANLPYIPTPTLRGLPIHRREPALALDGGLDGLQTIRRLLERAHDWLGAEGAMLLEIEATQGRAALALASKAYPRAAIRLHPDLEGRDRVLEIQQHA
jgi:release factor glutamine methyltransferase